MRLGPLAYLTYLGVALGRPAAEATFCLGPLHTGPRRAKVESGRKMFVEWSRITLSLKGVNC